MISFTNEHDNLIAEDLRDRGWTVEPPRQVTPELLTELGAPGVFSPAGGIIGISRGNYDATLDLTVEQAREVAERLAGLVRIHGDYDANGNPKYWHTAKSLSNRVIRSPRLYLVSLLGWSIAFAKDYKEQENE